MSISVRFFMFQLMIIVPFLAGLFLKSRTVSAEQSSRRIIRLNLIFIEPLIVFWSIWGLNLRLDMILLPVSGVLIVLAGIVFGRVALVFMPLQERAKASFLISSSIANHGFTMGAFLCYLFLGEKGLGLAFLFLSYFMLYVFTVIFPYARSVTHEHQDERIIRDYVLDLQNMPLLAVILGIGLQLFHIVRPGVPFPVDILMIISISLYYLSMGMNFITSSILSFARENISLALIKFMAVPASTAAVLAFIQLDSQLEAVMRIESFMPAAIYSVVASVLFELDTKLSTNLFVVNSLVFLFFILPLLFVFKGYILGI